LFAVAVAVLVKARRIWESLYNGLGDGLEEDDRIIEERQRREECEYEWWRRKEASFD